MSTAEFNDARRSSDLPALFEVLKQELPFFEEWLSLYQVDIEVFCSVDNPGRWLYWMKNLEFLSYSDRSNAVINTLTPDVDKETSRIAFGNRTNTGRSSIWEINLEVLHRWKFTPYIPWVQKKTKFKEFLETYPGSGVYIDSPSFSWQGKSAYLFGSRGHTRAYELPHLGNQRFELTPQTNNNGRRNLDFLCLDGLEIMGSMALTFPRSMDISFSSCENMKIRDGNLDDLVFSNSIIRNLLISSSRIKRLGFQRCSVANSVFERTNVDSFTAKNNQFISVPSIYESTIQTVNYEEGGKGRFAVNDINVLSALRVAVAHTAAGTQQKQDLLLQLKRLERISFRDPFLYYPEQFPKRFNTKKSADIIKSFIYRRSSRGHFKEDILEKIKYFDQCFTPTILAKRTKYLLLFTGSKINSIVWGYGLRPVRVLSVSLSVVLLFSVIYYFYGPSGAKHDPLASVYFSTVTFTTLGYGDIKPIDEKIRILCGIQALVGATLMGLFVGSIARKSTL